VRQTTDPRKAETNLVAALDSGYPPIVWADAWTLPYNGFSGQPTYGAMFPLVVFGCENGMVSVSDRSSQPLHVASEKFTDARGKVKQVKHRLMTLQPPNFDRLPSAVQKGIWQCINLFTEMPPRGTKDNFGLAALEKWADMLTNTRNKQSWTRFFPRGAGLYSALAGHPSQPGAFQWICTWGAADGAERGLYADFLDEAATILEKPGLRDAAERFRDSAAAWNTLSDMMLPDTALPDMLLPEAMQPLFETRYLLVVRRRLFIELGEASLEERHLINQRLAVIRAEAAADFPLSEIEVRALLERLAEQVLVIRRIEGEAVEQMQAAMA
jgi:hypothetical protein